MKQLLKRYWKVVLWTGVIAWICFTPSSEEGHGFLSFLTELPYFDKFVHLFIFAVYSFFLAIAATTPWKANSNIFLWVLLPAFGYAALTELIQWLFIPTRSGDPADLLADSVGILLGLAAALFLQKNSRRQA